MRTKTKKQLFRHFRTLAKKCLECDERYPLTAVRSKHWAGGWTLTFR